MKIRIFLLTLLIASVAFFFFKKTPHNPFDLGIAPKENLSQEDYLQIQEVLNAKRKDVELYVRNLYPHGKSGYASLEANFIGRCLRGVNQVLIDPKQGWFPEVKLEKINAGGNRCIVTSAPFLRSYPEFARTKTEILRQTGFNGYYLYFIGGYPNPTGKEIQYVGVPYAMKIFAMMEAQKRGFSSVIWVDSAVIPLKDPSPIFERLESFGAFIHGWGAPPIIQLTFFLKLKSCLKN
jgi:hypothetical protein